MSTVPVAISGTTDMALAAEQREVDAVKQILFFDGVCGLCNWSVDFVLKRDQAGKIQFSPLQGETAKALLSPEDVADIQSMVFLFNGKVFRRSSAVVRVLWQLSPYWQAIGCALWLIPLPLRNLGYKVVASRRYQLFGKKATCRIPTPEERSRFLP